MDPFAQLIMQMMAGMMSAPTGLDKKGKPIPDDLASQNDQATFQKKILDMMSDPTMIAMMGGSASNPDAYQDVESGKYNDYDLPDDPLAPYLSLSDTSEEGQIARNLLDGKSPDEIVKEAVKNGAAPLPEDEKRIRATATDLFKQQHSYQSTMGRLPNMTKGDDGSYTYTGPGEVVGNKIREPIMTRSDAAQMYDKLGIPTPDQQWGERDFGYDAGTADADRSSRDSQLQALMDKAKGLQGGEAEAITRDKGLASQGNQFNSLMGLVNQVRQPGDGGYSQLFGTSPQGAVSPPPVSGPTNPAGNIGTPNLPPGVTQDMITYDKHGNPFVGTGMTPVPLDQYKVDDPYNVTGSPDKPADYLDPNSTWNLTHGQNQGISHWSQLPNQADRLQGMMADPQFAQFLDGNGDLLGKDTIAQMMAARDRVYNKKSGARERQQYKDAQFAAGKQRRSNEAADEADTYSSTYAKKRAQLKNASGVSPAMQVMLERIKSLQNYGF